MSLNTTLLAMNATDIDRPTLLSYCLGVTITLICMPGLIGNILVSYVEVSKGYLSSNHASMYMLSFNLLMADTIHLSVLAFYLGPASALQNWLLPDNWTRQIPGRVMMVCWQNMLIDLCLLGANRYVAVCKAHAYPVLFSKKRTKVMIFISWIIGILLCLIGEQLLPCCSVYLYYKVYSYGFVETGVNYNNTYLIIPTNTFTSLFVFMAYCLVIYNIHQSNSRVAEMITAESQQRRRAREIRYAIQLIIISSVFVAVWVLFNIFGNTIPPDKATSGWFSVVVVLEIINGSANSIVCILFNKEIKTALKKMFCCCCISFSDVTTTSVQPLTQGQTEKI